MEQNPESLPAQAAVPPALPQMYVPTESAKATYLKAMGTLVPTLFIATFATLIIFPKMEKLWVTAGLTDSQVQGFMDVTRFLVNYFQLIIGLVTLAFVLLEINSRAWPRYRRTVVSSVVVLFHTWVLFGMTLLATMALLAVPMVIEGVKLK